MDYNSIDFLNTLDETGRDVFHIIHGHIADIYPEYKPFDIRPTNKSGAQWLLAYRKRPKTGKAICNLESMDGKLSVRFSCLSSMAHALLLRQNEFSAGMRKHILQQTICCVDRRCRSYGGNTPCPWRQHYWINRCLVGACPYPWIYFDSLTQDDAGDIRLLIDMQMKHTTQNAKEIKGSGYTEENREKCGDIQVITLGQTDLNIDSFHLLDCVKNPARLDKYAQLYHLIPMGENDGIWFYQSSAAASGGDRSALAYEFTQIPQGRYAAVTIAEPMTFSANRAWNYICEWITDEKKSIREIRLGGHTSAVYFVRFRLENNVETMQALVPLGGG